MWAGRREESGEEGRATDTAHSQTRQRTIGSASTLVQREEGLRRSGSHTASFLPQSSPTVPFRTGALYMLALTGLLKAVVTADPYPPQVREFFERYLKFWKLQRWGRKGTGTVLTWTDKDSKHSQSRYKIRNKRERNHFRDTEATVTGPWSDNCFFLNPLNWRSGLLPVIFKLRANIRQTKSCWTQVGENTLQKYYSKSDS